MKNRWILVVLIVVGCMFLIGCTENDVDGTPTPTPTPPANMYVIVSDTFDSNVNDWPTGTYEWESGMYNRSLSNGKYRWEALAQQGFGLHANPKAADPVTDFYLTVDARLDSGPNDSEYGVVFRDDNNSYYIFQVNDRQKFSSWLRYMDEWIKLIDWKKTSAIRSGEVNRIGVLAEGSHFSFFINDQFVADAEDDRLAGGDAGLFIQLSEGAENVFEFDNFEISTTTPPPPPEWYEVLNDSQIKEKAQTINWEDLLENYEQYNDTVAEFKGQALRIYGDYDGPYDVMIWTGNKPSVSSNYYYNSNPIYLDGYYLKPKIVKEDIVISYGVPVGVYTYKNTANITVTVPKLIPLLVTPPTSEPLTFLSYGKTRLPDAAVGEYYSFSFCKPERAKTSDLCGAFNNTTDPTGGIPPYHFELGSGVGFPPFGINLNLNGMLKGTPSIEGEREFEVCAVDLVETYACQRHTLYVEPTPTPTPTPTKKPLLQDCEEQEEKTGGYMRCVSGSCPADCNGVSLVRECTGGLTCCWGCPFTTPTPTPTPTPIPTATPTPTPTPAEDMTVTIDSAACTVRTRVYGSPASFTVALSGTASGSEGTSLDLGSFTDLSWDCGSWGNNCQRDAGEDESTSWSTQGNGYFGMRTTITIKACIAVCASDSATVACPTS